MKFLQTNAFIFCLVLSYQGCQSVYAQGDAFGEQHFNNLLNQFDAQNGLSKAGTTMPPANAVNQMSPNWATTQPGTSPSPPGQLQPSGPLMPNNASPGASSGIAPMRLTPASILRYILNNGGSGGSDHGHNNPAQLGNVQSYEATAKNEDSMAQSAAGQASYGPADQRQNAASQAQYHANAASAAADSAYAAAEGGSGDAQSAAAVARNAANDAQAQADQARANAANASN